MYESFTARVSLARLFVCFLPLERNKRGLPHELGLPVLELSKLSPLEIYIVYVHNQQTVATNMYVLQSSSASNITKCAYLFLLL